MWIQSQTEFKNSQNFPISVHRTITTQMSQLYHDVSCSSRTESTKIFLNELKEPEIVNGRRIQRKVSNCGTSTRSGHRKGLCFAAVHTATVCSSNSAACD